MIVFRLGSGKYSNDLSGEGAKLGGGRWNHVGTPCIYAAESRALCTVEYSAHKHLYAIPAALTITKYLIPDNKIQEFKIKDLPGNWKNFPHEDEPRTFGTNLLNASGPLIMSFPSVMIPQELNYVLNVQHPDFNQIAIEGVEPYTYDIRIKQ